MEILTRLLPDKWLKKYFSEVLQPNQQLRLEKSLKLSRNLREIRIHFHLAPAFVFPMLLQPSPSGNLNSVFFFRSTNQVHGQSKPAFIRHGTFPCSRRACLFSFATIFHFLFPARSLLSLVSNQNCHVIIQNLVLVVCFMYRIAETRYATPQARSHSVSSFL